MLTTVPILRDRPQFKNTSYILGSTVKPVWNDWNDIGGVFSSE